MPQTPIQPGFIVLHSNLSENLAETVVSWLSDNPLEPLEEEIFLVQSNGMAEWLKMELASMGGVYAATRVELPAKFMWQTYRQVLGRDAVPSDSPLDKIPMTWRLMQLLPTLLEDPDFAPIDGFLKEDEPDRQLQLAARLADQFDQYQIYRADWLELWAQGKDVLLEANGTERSIPDDQRWQPKLWRALLNTLDDAQQAVIRPRLHKLVLDKLNQTDSLAGKVVRRVVVFCVSQFPWSSLQELAALSKHTQVVLAVFNPCRFYWGDIIEGRELLRALKKRQPHRNGVDLSGITIDQMHQNANPLLASWGRQGRDFIRQLDEFDDAQQIRKHFASLKIDLFDESVSQQDSMLKQVQNQIRDLDPLPREPAPDAIASSDRSIVFHVAHSKVRELEILHDQLLKYLAEPSNGTQLQPRDIVVMVPDIEQMAPAVRAVFGQYKRQDPRYIPYDISDLGAKADSPLISAIEWLLRIPQQRTRLSELIDLLEVPAIASRFGIDQDALPKLVSWMEGAGIRWGLNEAQRQDLQLDACGEQNTALFGLQRMLLGYCSGAATGHEIDQSFHEISPYAEVGGLEAELAGALAHFLKALTTWWEIARTEATPAEWAERGRALLTSLVKPIDDSDKQALSSLNSALVVWQRACEQANYAEQVPLAIARAAWLEALDRPTLSRRFRAGGVTFCSLMPMRVIPFQVVCLLGMNEGDYPRTSVRSDFDLMSLKGVGRPGDRSRREDDRQLLLEAVLSARQTLYVSWSGKSVRDNSEQPPSVLIAQLRDYLKANWGKESVDLRTTEHPLQPFSRQYFETGTGLMTYASEWRAAHADFDQESGDQDALTKKGLSAFMPNEHGPLTMQQLSTFLRNPVKAFFRQRFSVVFEDQENDDFDDEPFGVNHLERYFFIKDLLAARPSDLSASDVDRFVEGRLDQVLRAGRLPVKALGEMAQMDLAEVLKAILQSLLVEQAKYGDLAQRRSMRFEHDGIVLEDWLDHLCEPGERASATDDEASESEHFDVVSLTVEPGKVCVKAGSDKSETKKKPVARADKLLNAWITSMVASACDVRVRLVVVAQDAVLCVRPMPKEIAEQTLRMLLSLWQKGMNQPLPLPLKTSIEFVNVKPTDSTKRSKSALTEYEGSQGYDGSDPKPGEGVEMCLSRQFPDYESLDKSGFESLAQETYQPLIDWVSQYVVVQAHSSSEDVEVGESVDAASGEQA